MEHPSETSPDATLEAFIEAYESAQQRDGRADPAEFLPPPGHPLYASVLRELVRVDLEYGWQRGQPHSLDDYRQRFPALFDDPDSIAQLAFEEYRQRCQALQSPDREEYRRAYGVSTDDWPGPASSSSRPAADHPGAHAGRDSAGKPNGPLPNLEAWLSVLTDSTAAADMFSALHRSDPASADLLARALTELPEPGSEFLGFHLLAELGRGAFGRVYLARQPELADRLVALKVSADLGAESQTLAQLQHPAIVPIYSLHRAGLLQAVCMPYRGATTVADLLTAIRERPMLPVSASDLADLLLRCRKPLPEPPPSEAITNSSPRPPREGPHAEREDYSPPQPEVPSEPRAGSYADAVIHLAAELAEGLAHAHERGILHRDLKPANILLTDAGQPMLLDFNLSDDLKRPGRVAWAAIGGTLPYMAPSHLEAFHTGKGLPDERSDIYSLGVILCELLTGKYPFPVRRGELSAIVPVMIADRQTLPLLRESNLAISPSLESIIRRCLEPDPAWRYPSAAALAEDLHRQLRNQPLRYAGEPSFRERASKWFRRHPRLSSAGIVAALVALLLLALLPFGMMHRDRVARLEATQALDGFRRELRQVQFELIHLSFADSPHLDKAAAHARQLLGRYKVLDDPAWQEASAVAYLPAAERQRLAEDVGDLLLLWARVTLAGALRRPDSTQRRDDVLAALSLNERAEGCFASGAVPPVLWSQRAELAQRLNRDDEAQRCRARAQADSPPTARSLLSLAGEHMVNGRYRPARELLEQARRLDPQHFWVWFDLGLCNDLLGQPGEAVACFGTCIALAPDFAPPHYLRGLAHLRQRQYADAVADFDAAIRLDPELVAAYLNRALARLGQNQFAAALADLDAARQRGASPARILLMQARVKELAGDRAGADRDRTEGLRQEPTDVAGLLARGSALVSRDPAESLRAFDRALAIHPASLPALQSKAHLLAEKLGLPKQAIAVLDQVVALYPDFAPGWAGRGVLLARQGRRPEALRDAGAALACDNTPAMQYQVAGIFALTSRTHPDDQDEAFRLLTSALRQGYGRDLVKTDDDFAAIRGTPRWDRLLEELARQPPR